MAAVLLPAVAAAAAIEPTYDARTWAALDRVAKAAAADDAGRVLMELYSPLLAHADRVAAAAGMNVARVGDEVGGRALAAGFTVGLFRSELAAAAADAEYYGAWRTLRTLYGYAKPYLAAQPVLTAELDRMLRQLPHGIAAVGVPRVRAVLAQLDVWVFRTWTRPPRSQAVTAPAGVASVTRFDNPASAPITRPPLLYAEPGTLPAPVFIEPRQSEQPDWLLVP